jgi:hypothetical protein
MRLNVMFRKKQPQAGTNALAVIFRRGGDLHDVHGAIGTGRHDICKCAADIDSNAKGTLRTTLWGIYGWGFDRHFVQRATGLEQPGSFPRMNIRSNFPFGFAL